MNICLHSPYFPKHLGGGEKYLLDTALAMTQYGTVTLAVPQAHSLTTPQEKAVREKYTQFLGQDLSGLTLSASPLGTAATLMTRLKWTSQFDVLYYITDGSFLPSLARKNILHIQVPLPRQPLSPWERLKKLNWQFVNTNSAFTKTVVERQWRLSVDAVHHPMVERLSPPPARKEKIILHVGRFFRQLHSKRQDVLIEIFRDLLHRYPQESRGWKLVLIGSVEDLDYAARIRTMAADLPITVIHSVSRQQLSRWYDRASLYWHATGFGMSEKRYPAKMEHFGISTVEAMAAGAVPIVIRKGGQPEILGDELANLLWSDKKMCLEKTVSLMNNTDRRLQLSQIAQARAKQFGSESFKRNIADMFTKLGLITA